MPGSVAIPAAVAVAAAAATATATALLGLGLAHLERATVEVLAVQGLHGLGGIRTRHLDEAEAARAASVAVVDQGERFDRAVRLEQLTHGLLGRGERKITDKKLGHLDYSQKKDGNKRISTCWFGDAFRCGWTGSDGAPKRRNEPDKTGLRNHQTRAFYPNLGPLAHRSRAGHSRPSGTGCQPIKDLSGATST